MTYYFHFIHLFSASMAMMNKELEKINKDNMTFILLHTTSSGIVYYKTMSTHRPTTQISVTSFTWPLKLTRCSSDVIKPRIAQTIEENWLMQGLKCANYGISLMFPTENKENQYHMEQRRVVPKQQRLSIGLWLFTFRFHGKLQGVLDLSIPKTS